MFKDRFKNQIALITGGASGIGKAVALRLTQEGTQVIIADHNKDALRLAQQELKQHGLVSSAVLDIANENQVKVTLESINKVVSLICLLS